MKRAVRRTCIGLGSGLGFGLLPWAYILVGYVQMGGMYWSRDWYVCIASYGLANFILAVVGVSIFWAVRDSRLRRASAALLFLGVAVGSVFVPGALMIGSKPFLPYIFSGDGGWLIMLSPFGMALFAAVALVVFCISLVFVRWHCDTTQVEQKDH